MIKSCCQLDTTASTRPRSVPYLARARPHPPSPPTSKTSLPPHAVLPPRANPPGLQSYTPMPVPPQIIGPQPVTVVPYRRSPSPPSLSYSPPAPVGVHIVPPLPMGVPIVPPPRPDETTPPPNEADAVVRTVKYSIPDSTISREAEVTCRRIAARQLSDT